jgi:pimeloyl-ACP methyl ester carboxylesterase
MTAQRSPVRGKRTVDVDGVVMAYVDTSPPGGVETAASGGPVVLLHGNPTSSFLWWHVTSELHDVARWDRPGRRRVEARP